MVERLDLGICDMFKIAAELWNPVWKPGNGIMSQYWMV